MAGAATMGRPKKGAKRPERPPDERQAIIHLKGTADYAYWLHRVHQETHIPKATIVRLALAEWAQRHGAPPPPEL
jgi:hypothetical protein